ncbi:hypothetical protein EVG20_g6481 [Dentipellis fragilis]|uniref:Uncharacterized protein n=1 Tax=Dentipellis fragilis TaxID=205917 RepID=A0A4Y9YKH3_9AGAM|nr:hypothetical protein EVG20_g6481 [Dentipellis fragilis]
MSSLSNTHLAFNRIPQSSNIPAAASAEMQNNDKLPLSKQGAAILKINQEFASACHRVKRGEITHAEFLRITSDCLDRARVQQEASWLLCEQARKGEISREEFGSKIGYSEEDWRKVRAKVERQMEVQRAEMEAEAHARFH